MPYLQIRERAVCEEGEKRGGESEGRWCAATAAAAVEVVCMVLVMVGVTVVVVSEGSS